MNGPTRPIRIEGYVLGVPKTIRPEYERAYVAFFLHSVLGTTEMSKQTPKLHKEFYGPNRNPVVTQELWRNVGHHAHEDAQRYLSMLPRSNPHQPAHSQTAPHPTDLVGLMSAIEDHPEFVARFARTRTA